jgi:hypothetical protein
MKTPTPDSDTILYGETAQERMLETWDDIGQGKVGAEVIGPWLIIDRANGKYRAFISLVDDTLVLVLNPDATTRHVPKEYRPDEDVGETTIGLLGEAFDSLGGGMYPVSDGSRFAIGFRDGDEMKQLNVGLTRDGVWVSDA